MLHHTTMLTATSEELEHRLHERSKELALLYHTVHLLQDTTLGVTGALERIVQSLPTGFQYPEDTSARIVVGGREYRTGELAEAPYVRAEITLQDGPAGFLEVRCRRGDAPFLKEERALCKAVADMLAAYLNRKRAEQERQDSEKRLRQITDHMLDVVISTDTQGRCQFATPSLENFLGYAPSATVGRPVFELVHPEDRPRTVAAFQHSIAHHAPSREILRFQHAAGHVVWLEAVGQPTTDEGGNVTGTVIAARDVTELRHQAERLERLAEFRQGLVNFVTETLSDTPDEHLFQRLLARAVEVIPGVQAGSIQLREADGLFAFAAALNFDLEPLKAIRLAAHELLIPAGSRQPVIVHDLGQHGNQHLPSDKDELFHKHGKLQAIRGTIAVPIYQHDELVAVFNLDTFDPAVSFDDETVDMAKAFGYQVGPLLKRLALEQTLRRLAEFRRGLVELTAESLGQGLHPDFYQHLLTRAVAVIPGAEAGSLLLKDSAGYYRYVAAVNYDFSSLQHVFFAQHEVVWELQKEPHLVRDFSKSYQLDDARRTILLTAGRVGEIKVSLAIPIILEDEVVAILHLDNFHDAGALGEEAREMAQAFAGHVATLIKRLKLELELEHLAYYDPLTLLANRTLLNDRLRQAITQSKRTRQPLAVLFLDLDNFKIINDSLGHKVGDELLKEVADRLLTCVREGDTVARQGGDEFVLVLSQLHSPQDAAIIAQKVIDGFRPAFRLGTHEIHVTPSVGISVCPDDAMAVDGLLKHADLAMYRAKELGKNTYSFFSADMDRRSSGPEHA